MEYSEVSDFLNTACGEWSAQYSQMKLDLAYLSGGKDMWASDVWGARINRPRLSLQLSAPYVDKIAKSIRTQPPSVEIYCEEQEIAEYVSDFVRGIEKRSSATSAYSQAVYHASACGIGWLRLKVVETKRGAEIRIVSDKDPCTIYIDPLSREIDGSDAKEAVHIGYVSIEEAKRLGVANPCRTTVRDFHLPDDAVIDATYYKVTEKGLSITRWVGEEMVGEEYLIEGFKHILCVPVYGYAITGTSGLKYTGLLNRTRPINDALNIVTSNIMELVASAPRAPILTATESVDNLEEWKNLNTEVRAHLRFKAYDKDGRPLPVPQRMDNSPQTQALQGVNDFFIGLLGRSTGISDAQLGELQSAGESGKSLVARLEQSSADALYIDNFTTSLTYLYRLIICLTPHIYDTSRAITFVDQYNTSRLETLDMSQVITEDVEEMLEVEVKSGPSMEAQRRSASDALSMMISSMGENGVSLLGEWAKSANLPNQKQIIEVLQRVYPNLYPKEDEVVDPMALQAMQKADELIAQKDSEIQYLAGLVSQLQQQVAYNADLLALEKYKIDVNAQVQLAKSDKDFIKATTVEQIKQSGEDERQTKDLVAKATEHEDDLLADIANRHIESSKNVPFVGEPKLPISIAKGVSEAKQNSPFDAEKINEGEG